MAKSRSRVLIQMVLHRPVELAALIGHVQLAERAETKCPGDNLFDAKEFLARP